jgi:hypothetical protein
MANRPPQVSDAPRPATRAPSAVGEVAVRLVHEYLGAGGEPPLRRRASSSRSRLRRRGGP